MNGVNVFYSLKTRTAGINVHERTLLLCVSVIKALLCVVKALKQLHMFYYA